MSFVIIVLWSSSECCCSDGSLKELRHSGSYFGQIHVCLRESLPSRMKQTLISQTPQKSRLLSRKPTFDWINSFQFQAGCLLTIIQQLPHFNAIMDSQDLPTMRRHICSENKKPNVLDFSCFWCKSCRTPAAQFHHLNCFVFQMQDMFSFILNRDFSSGDVNPDASLVFSLKFLWL